MKPTMDEWWGGGLHTEKRDHQSHVTTLQRRSLPASVHVGTLRHISALSSSHRHACKLP